MPRGLPRPIPHNRPVVRSCTPRGRFRLEDFRISTSRRLSWAPVTEIPEHLLKRSQAAGAQAGAQRPQPTPRGPAARRAAATSAHACSALRPPQLRRRAAPVGPPPPKPDIPVVAAAKARKKIPFWAIATLSMLPLWAFMYVRALTPDDRADSGPARRWRHRSTRVARAATAAVAKASPARLPVLQREVLKTFPHIEDQLRWVYGGSDGY